MKRSIITSASLLIVMGFAAGCGGSDAATTRNPPPLAASTPSVPTESPASFEAGGGETMVASTEGVGPVSSPAADPDRPFEAVVVDTACPSDAPASARCYRIDVPANWAEPAGSLISLPVVVVPATGPLVSPDPLVVLAGGPGGSGIGAAAAWSDPHRDVVLYDQRGSGAAQPALTCPERNEAWVANLQRADAFEEECAAIVEAYAACRARLEASGIDLDDYDTEASVRDLDAIRVALGYEKWNLLGASYGARLALAAMRSTPNMIRSVVLDSVYDVTDGGMAATKAAGDLAVAEVIAACDEDVVCRSTHPDLVRQIGDVALRYEAAPLQLEVDLGDGRGARTFVITGTDMMAGLFDAVNDPVLLPLIPSMIGDLAAGDTSVVELLLRRGVALQDTIAWGMHLSMNCADNAGLDPDAEARVVADPGRFELLFTEPLCSAWPVEATSSTFNEPVRSDIPTLVIAGRFDSRTSPSGSEQAARRLGSATFAVWPNRGHIVTGDPCANTLLSAFLDDPAAQLDLTCVDTIRRPDFQ